MTTHSNFVWVTASLGVPRHDTYWRVLIADELVWLEHYSLTDAVLGHVNKVYTMGII